MNKSKEINFYESQIKKIENKMGKNENDILYYNTIGNQKKYEKAQIKQDSLRLQKVNLEDKLKEIKK